MSRPTRRPFGLAHPGLIIGLCLVALAALLPGRLPRVVGQTVPVTPPANDNFASATVVTSLPYSNTVDPTAATTETNEPQPACTIFGFPTATVWYAFTPSAGETVTANSPNFATEVNAYTGASLASLSPIGCSAFGSGMSLRVTAGQTYYFQVAAGGNFGVPSSLTFTLILTPPPTANFFFSPFDPSTFDTINFFDFSQDPGGFGIQSWAWSFGDGATASVSNPTHHYAVDGDYTVKDSVTTFDGRSGSTTQTVHVRTHDVAIVKLDVPQSAKSGQTRRITVSIANSRYPETVQVQLLKGGPSGFQPVGTLTQSVGVTQGGHTTPFSFDYTFTSDDAVAGKVTFEATATLSGARDALPTDNTVIALPTVVH